MPIVCSLQWSCNQISNCNQTVVFGITIKTKGPCWWLQMTSEMLLCDVARRCSLWLVMSVKKLWFDSFERCNLRFNTSANKSIGKMVMKSNTLNEQKKFPIFHSRGCKWGEGLLNSCLTCGSSNDWGGGYVRDNSRRGVLIGEQYTRWGQIKAQRQKPKRWSRLFL